MFNIKKHILSIIILFSICLLLSSCVSTDYLSAGRNMFYRGHFQEASEHFENPKVNSKNKLLYDLEAGSAFMMNNEFKKSAALFNTAYKQIQIQEIASAKEIALDFTISDEINEYHPAFYEKFLLHSLNALNYIFLNDYDDALVEAKLSLKSLERYEKNFGFILFIHYIAGLSYELNNDINSAYIEYKKIYINTKIGFLIPKLIKMAKYINREDELKEYIEENKLFKTSENKNLSEAIFIIFKGKAPIKKELFYLTDDDYKIALPYYDLQYSSFSPPEIKSDNTVKTPIKLLDLFDITQKLNNKQFMMNLLKEITRKNFRKEVIHKTENKTNDFVSDLLKIASYYFIKPDLRVWETLPQVFYIYYDYFPEGEHFITIDGNYKFNFTISKEKKNIFLLRVF